MVWGLSLYHHGVVHATISTGLGLSWVGHSSPHKYLSFIHSCCLCGTILRPSRCERWFPVKSEQTACVYLWWEILMGAGNECKCKLVCFTWVSEIVYCHQATDFTFLLTLWVTAVPLALHFSESTPRHRHNAVLFLTVLYASPATAHSLIFPQIHLSLTCTCVM